MYISPLDKLKDGPLKIGIIGCGNWASAICRVVGTNAKRYFIFDDEVKMWVKEEIVEQKKLSEIINEKHENIKYLKGISLPENIVAYPDLSTVINGTDLLIFVIPCQFLEATLTSIEADKTIKIEEHVRAISLTKGLVVKNKQLTVSSKLITDILKINCCALSGANIAKNIAEEEFSEATIGGNDKESMLIWQRVFDLPYFKINCLLDTSGVEICGALKNIIALASGFCDGLSAPSNTKSAIIRIGIAEIRLFAKLFFGQFNENVFFESCGFADIITSFLEGRNAKCSAEYVKRKQKHSWEELEKEILDGQKLQGTVTLKCVYEYLKEKGHEKKFPLFDVLYKISFLNEEPTNLIKTFMTETVVPLVLN